MPCYLMYITPDNTGVNPLRSKDFLGYAVLAHVMAKCLGHVFRNAWVGGSNPFRGTS